MLRRYNSTNENNMALAHILVVDDEPDIRQLVSEILEDEGYEVTAAEDGEAARSAFAKTAPDLVLLDIWMPDVDGITLLKEWSSGTGLTCPVVIMSGHGTVETAVEATRLGAHDFVQKPISLAKLLSIVSTALVSSQSDQPPPRVVLPATNEPVGNSALIQVLKSKAEQAAQHESTVLITGEPGSGRESLARFIHDRGARRGKFLALDACELDSEAPRNYLLGSEKSDTGQPGLFDQANGGTLFIPDIQEINTKALKIISQVIESGHFTQDGGSESQGLNCRIIASGSNDLKVQAQKDPVLEQMYYLVNVLALDMPPLRERQDDVPELIKFYADWFPNHENLPYRPFSVSAQNRLRNHSWPGNIRELRNLVQRLLILGGDGEVSVAEVEEALRQNPSTPAGSETDHPRTFDLPLREAREQFEREYLIYQLRRAGGSVGKLAESVGMERTHLYRKLRALGIDPKKASRTGEEK
jgi:DNA-binding NtrC family response regulator